VEGSERDLLSGVFVVSQRLYGTLRRRIRSHSREAHPRPPTCEVAAPAARPVLFCDPAVMMAVSSSSVMLLTLRLGKGSL
jgi:hypothetical protein